MKYQIKEKHCPACDDKFIEDNGRPMSNHRQIRVELTEGHTTDLAICRKHDLDDKELKKLTRTTLDYVAKNMVIGRKEALIRLEFVSKWKEKS